MTGRTTTPRIDFSWHEDAACRGEDLYLFFGPDGERGPEREARQRKAKRICKGCPVLDMCLEDAFARHDKHGVRGGLDEDERAEERARWLRQRSRARAAA